MPTEKELTDIETGDKSTEEKIVTAADEAGVDTDKTMPDEAKKKAAKGVLNNKDTPEKPLQKSVAPELTLSKPETENIIVAVGQRVIDWRRMTDAEAGEEMTRIAGNIGAVAFWRSVKRVREIIAKPRTLALAAICSLGLPEVPNYIKNPPQWDADELWRAAFQAFVLDERRMEDAALRKRLLDQACDEQARA